MLFAIFVENKGGNLMIIGIIIILLLVLFLPFTKLIGRDLELFLLVMGMLSVLVSQVMTWDLVKDALVDPINITIAVLVAGLLFRWFKIPDRKSTRLNSSHVA